MIKINWALFVILAFVLSIIFVWMYFDYNTIGGGPGSIGQVVQDQIIIQAVSLRQFNTSIYFQNTGRSAVTVKNASITFENSTRIYQREQLAIVPDVVSVGPISTITIANLGFIPQENATYTLEIFTDGGFSDSLEVSSLPKIKP